jgi:hypothetical protein
MMPKTPPNVIHYENSSFFWTLLGVMKPSLSIGFRCQVSVFSATAGLKNGQFNRKRNFAILFWLFLDCGSGF